MAEPTYPHTLNEKFVWWVDRDKIAIAYQDENYPTRFYSSTEGGTTIRCYSSNIAGTDGGDKFSSNLSESPDLPPRFHMALIAYVLRRLYERNPETIQVAQYWGQRYMEYVLKGTKYSSTNRTSGFKIIIPDNYSKI